MRALFGNHPIVHASFVVVERRGTGEVAVTVPAIGTMNVAALADLCRSKGHRPLYGIRVIPKN